MVDKKQMTREEPRKRKSVASPKDWISLRLETIAKKERPISYGVVQTGPHVSDGVKCIRVTDLIDGEITNKDLITTSIEISNSYKRTILQEGDIILALRGKIGQAAIVKKEFEGCNLTRGVALICTRKEYYNFFVYQQLSSPSFKSVFKKSLNGSALKEISIGTLRKIPIALPRAKSEQKKIATVLRTWDEGIEKTQSLIDHLKQRNKGLAQRLLTGKKRLKVFKGRWKREPLEVYFKERKEIGYKNLPLLSVGESGVYTQSESNKKDTSNADKALYKRICVGDIGYNTMRMWQGRSALSELEGIVSPAYTIVTATKNADAKFFSYVFKLEDVIHRFFRNSQGLVSDTLNCKFKDFKIVKVDAPPTLEEQKAIAKTLLRAKQQVQLLDKELALLKEQKKGLMQKLLNGEIRVKVSERDAKNV